MAAEGSMELAQWITFAEAGNQQRLQLLDGTRLQGWIMEITDDSLLVSSGDGERGVDRWVRLTEIDLDTLAYFDTQQRRWMRWTASSPS